MVMTDRKQIQGEYNHQTFYLFRVVYTKNTENVTVRNSIVSTSEN